jgi:endonuclease/exonuclease/phosphatase family metal-dependent hydrolase
VTGLPVDLYKPDRPATVNDKSVTFVSYNVLVDAVETDKRAKALFTIMKNSNADVIALQEMSDWLLAKLKQEDWAKAYYRAGADMDCLGNVILSKFPIQSAGCQPLPTKQWRRVLIAALKTGDREMIVATSHMESPLESDAMRAKQFNVMFDRLAGAQDAVLLGDFNLGDGEPAEREIPANYVDVWKALKPKDPGFTWNIEKSDMARDGGFPGETSRRLDRILVRSDVWKPKDIRIIGDEPIVPGKKELFPSDHFGLMGAIVR